MFNNPQKAHHIYIQIILLFFQFPIYNLGELNDTFGQGRRAVLKYQKVVRLFHATHPLSFLWTLPAFALKHLYVI